MEVGDRIVTDYGLVGIITYKFNLEFDGETPYRISVLDSKGKEYGISLILFTYEFNICGDNIVPICDPSLMLDDILEVSEHNTDLLNTLIKEQIDEYTD